jgi:SAM-dependent methyltransferase
MVNENKTSAEPKKARYAWLSSPLGQVFLEQEKKEVGELINDFRGYNSLGIGPAPFLAVMQKSNIVNKLWLDTESFGIDHCISITAKPDKLPIRSDEIQFMYLAHCLGSSNNPHEVLRESYRVLAPEGQVIISGFNPWSLWGLKRLLGSLASYWPWNSRFMSIIRLKDWLALLGFELLSTQFYFFRPPVAFGLEKLHWMENLGRFLWPIFGGYYVILARKRTIPLTPIRAVWTQKDTVPEAGWVRPAA